MMDRTIFQLNIEHFRRLLENSELDETKRHTVLQLLAEEETKLAAALADGREKRKSV